MSVFKEKRGIWDPLPELTITSPYLDIVDSEVHLSIPTMTNADKLSANRKEESGRGRDHVSSWQKVLSKKFKCGQRKNLVAGEIVGRNFT